MSSTGAFEGEETVVWVPHEKWGAPENQEGTNHAFHPVVGRYVRYWSAGSSNDHGTVVWMLEADIFGLPTPIFNPS